MFKKLLSNLPFNPSLIGQVSFYAQRMHQETRVRRLGLIMVVLSVIVQMFAVVSPPEPTLAHSANDIVPGGFVTKAQAVENCRKDSYDFQTILAHFGINCEALERAAIKNIRSTDYNRKLLSLGRLPYAKNGERAVRIDGKTYYQRYLWSWDSGTHSTYQALVGTRTNGQPFIVLFNCGNPAVIEADPAPRPAQPKPKPSPAPPKPSPVATPQDACPDEPGIQTRAEQCDVCPHIPGQQLKQEECKPCEESESSDDTTACLVLSKQAGNVTQELENADGTTARAGDTLEYTLKAKNTGQVTVPKFTVEENVADILDYAVIVDTHGGKIDDSYTLTWAPADIHPGEELVRQLTIKIKDPVPQTPVSASNPGTFDLTMTNVYGNAVSVSLPSSVMKTTEQVVHTLPETGAGSTMMFAVAATVSAGYFFARCRLLAKELDIVRSEYNHGEDRKHE